VVASTRQRTAVWAASSSMLPVFSTIPEFRTLLPSSHTTRVVLQPLDRYQSINPPPTDDTRSPALRVMHLSVLLLPTVPSHASNPPQVRASPLGAPQNAALPRPSRATIGNRQNALNIYSHDRPSSSLDIATRLPVCTEGAYILTTQERRRIYGFFPQ